MDRTAAGMDTAEELAAGPWPGRSAANRTELDPIAFLKRSAALHPDRTAVVHGALRRTYDELDARVSRLASAPPSGRARVRGRVDAARALGRAPEGVRRAE